MAFLVKAGEVSSLKAEDWQISVKHCNAVGNKIVIES
jgi:hypothetical protein